MKAQLVKLSVCPCGFSLLNDKIPLGTIYDIDLTRLTRASILCGKCKKETPPMIWVWVGDPDPDRAGWLPLLIFEPVDDVVAFGL